MTITAGTYALDPAHTTVGFVARHAMVTKVRGNFAEFEGTLTVAENINESAANATVKTASIDTNNADRDAHVKNEDFFDVEKFPEVTFTATKFDVNEEGEGTVPVSGMSTRCAPTHTSRPKAAPCHSVIDL